MEQKHIFIIKPNTQSLKIEAMINSLMKGYDYEIKYTKYPRHATEIAKSYQKYNHRIYAVGGDGIVHEVVQGLIGSDNELVIIPAGTGNDFIRTIANTNDPYELLEMSLHLKAQPIDLIKANDIYCINVFCCAFDSDIANNVHNYRRIKYLPKTLQYVNVLVRRMSKYRLYPTTLYQNDKKIYEGSLIVGAFCNGKYFGGGFRIGKNADIQDGLIDINLVSSLKKRSIPYYLFLLFTGQLEKGKLYYHNKLKVLDIKTNQDVNIDGERYAKGCYHLEIVKNSLKVVLYK
ncbi:diacylglycerol/lipid kinase family protein [Thomasclavelia saccharogumia]|uniref:diacylglycerol/lipid kinase family protein n=1 Tax=Thomasclavelia saccharogumia TaxID=341225 RepID=UPI00047C2A06|nr:diacylglycerol kinase family protein [Thomasclavelia saccharogumia]